MDVYFLKDCGHMADSALRSLEEAGIEAKLLKRQKHVGGIINVWSTYNDKILVYVSAEGISMVMDTLRSAGFLVDKTPMGNVIVLGRPCILHRRIE